MLHMEIVISNQGRRRRRIRRAGGGQARVPSLPGGLPPQERGAELVLFADFNQFKMSGRGKGGKGLGKGGAKRHRCVNRLEKGGLGAWTCGRPTRAQVRPSRRTPSVAYSMTASMCMSEG